MSQKLKIETIIERFKIFESEIINQLANHRKGKEIYNLLNPNYTITIRIEKYRERILIIAHKNKTRSTYNYNFKLAEGGILIQYFKIIKI